MNAAKIDSLSRIIYEELTQSKIWI